MNKVAAIKLFVLGISFILYVFGIFSIEILICVLLAQNCLVNIFEPPIVIVNQYVVEEVVEKEE